jgi:geranylgeranyl pyrophosphate synthase
LNDHSALITLLEPIRPDLELVQQVLDDKLTAVEPPCEVAQPFHAAIRSRLRGGKPLRAALVILTGRLLDAPPTPFRTLAAAIEMLHAATLIHDDMVDDSPVRRGQATLHTVWPTGATVLAGDYLLARSASLVAELGHPALLKIFGDALCTMCAGEIRQMFADKDGADPHAEYYRGIEAKTASLFAAAMHMAALLAGATEAQVVALRSFGRDLGMAFQIVDDVLDLVAGEAELGKPAGSDLRQGLLTLPIVLYLEGATEDCPVRTVLAGQRDEDHVQAAIQAIRSSGAIAAAQGEARAYARQARESLLTLPGTPARRMLAALAEYVVARTR